MPRLALRTATVGEQIITDGHPGRRLAPCRRHHRQRDDDHEAVRRRRTSTASGATTLLPKNMGVTTQNWIAKSQYPADAYYKGAAGRLPHLQQGVVQGRGPVAGRPTVVQQNRLRRTDGFGACTNSVQAPCCWDYHAGYPAMLDIMDSEESARQVLSSSCLSDKKDRRTVAEKEDENMGEKACSTPAPGGDPSTQPRAAGLHVSSAFHRLFQPMRVWLRPKAALSSG